ncbi:MAG: isoaspartyl peptidase/L-asparaginase [Cyanobacteriota bacterium]
MATGTIGAVALDQQGQIFVGTSTGGRGVERLGRVSDSTTPAGTHASTEAGVSCTGVGEDILDECLAARTGGGWNEPSSGQVFSRGPSTQPCL